MRHPFLCPRRNRVPPRSPNLAQRPSKSARRLSPRPPISALRSQERRKSTRRKLRRSRHQGPLPLSRTPRRIPIRRRRLLPPRRLRRHTSRTSRGRKPKQAIQPPPPRQRSPTFRQTRSMPRRHRAQTRMFVSLRAVPWRPRKLGRERPRRYPPPRLLFSQRPTPAGQRQPAQRNPSPGPRTRSRQPWSAPERSA